jgi:hypothetical protein
MCAALAVGVSLAVLGVHVTPAGGVGARPGVRTGAEATAAQPAAPRPPSRYRIPAGAHVVSTGAQLRAALSGRRSQDIVLRDGMYGGRRPFVDSRGDRLYAQHLGQARFTAGLVIGGNHGPGGAVVRGVVFDLADRKLTDEGAAIEVWGSGAGTKILDVRINGHRSLAAGVFGKQTEGLRIQRVVAQGFTDYGIYADAYPSYGPLRHPMLLTDLDTRNVSRPVPRSANGTAEACIWVGSSAVVKRVRARSCAWMGLWTGTGATNSRLSGISVDQTPVGIYAEHYTRGTTFEQFHVGPSVRTGVVCEWDDPKTGGKPACVGDTFGNGTIDSTKTGVYLDEGTTRTTVHDVRFIHQSKAGIVNYRGRGNVFVRNDFSQMAQGAVPVSSDALP